MLNVYLSPSTTPNQSLFPHFWHTRALAAVGAALNIYFTLHYAQALWPEDIWASRAVALFWELSLLSFIALGVAYARQTNPLRAACMFALAASQMMGSAHAAAAYIGEVDSRHNEKAAATARAHADAQRTVLSLQSEIDQTLTSVAAYNAKEHITQALRAKESLPALRNQLARASVTRQSLEAQPTLLARGNVLLRTTPGAQSSTAHPVIAAMLQLITVALLTATALNHKPAKPTPPEAPAGGHPLSAAVACYERAKTMVVSTQVAATIRGLEALGVGKRGAKRWLEQMSAEGVLRRVGRRYERVG